MPKHEPMTAKAIGKSIKAKGLQKLKFYCQMCQKQCRDANGFKCHLTSEAHQRQLLLFSENPNRYMNDFSGEFMKDFLHLLKRRYSTKRVLANQVYQEYIKDRNHLHMNATRWCTLTGFVKWMGRKGICHVENNEKGWFITYIDRDPETLLKNENKAKKEKMFRDDDERQAKMIQEQIERGKRSEMEFKLKNSGEQQQQQDVDDESSSSSSKMIFKKEDEQQKIQFSLSVKKPSTEMKTPFVTVKKEEESDTTEIEMKTKMPPSMAETKPKPAKTAAAQKRKISALDEIISEQERWKARQAAKMAKNIEDDLKKKKLKPEEVTWMIPGIIVRVIKRKLGEAYYEKKARIESLESGTFNATIKILGNGGDVIRVNEQDLETVVPVKPGSRVMVLRGLYRGRMGTLAKVEKEHVLVTVDDASVDEPIPFQFDDISKV